MEQLRELVDVSFKDIEWGLWAKMWREFATSLAALLEDIDAIFLELNSSGPTRATAGTWRVGTPTPAGTSPKTLSSSSMATETNGSAPASDIY